MQARRLLITISTFALLGGMSATAADLTGLRVLHDDSSTRAVFDLSGDSHYRVFRLGNPSRLVVDLEQTRLSADFHAPGPNGAIANVRTGSPLPGTLRVVFELGAAVSSTDHMQQGPAGNQLVLELASIKAVAQPLPEDALPLASMPAQPSRLQPEVAQPYQQVQSDQQAQPGQQAQPYPQDTPAIASRLPMPTRTVQDMFGHKQRKLVVAIDAGHGGKDPGAHGPSGVREKAVTLAVARQLAQQVNADPGMRAVLIRDGDNFVPLKERYMKARAAQADLFISIHADASPDNSANGASVFVLSTRGASSQAARWLADQENAADLVGGVSLDQKDHNLAAVLLDLSQSATMRASDDIANQVLGSLKNVGRAHKPEIERANFVVLRSPDVPSMLIETGFITNPSEEQRLNSAAYRARLATAITEGVRKYFLDQAPAGSWYASQGGGQDAMPLASSPK